MIITVGLPLCLKMLLVTNILTVENGGEKYFTLGNFKNDSATNLDSMSSGFFYDYAYYYIDDFSVTDCTLGIEEINNNELNFTLFPNPVKEN
jgi:hypothetical protein